MLFGHVLSSVCSLDAIARKENQINLFELSMW